MERTLVLLKPDAVQRGLIGTILARFESKGLKLVGLKMRTFDRALLEQHYEVHKERPFYASLVEFMSSGPVVALALARADAVAAWLELLGPDDSKAATISVPGSVRALFGTDAIKNAAHGSATLPPTRMLPTPPPRRAPRERARRPNTCSMCSWRMRTLGSCGLRRRGAIWMGRERL